MSWITRLNAAMNDINNAGRSLDLAIASLDGPPEQLGEGWRRLIGRAEPGLMQPDCAQSAAAWAAQLENAASGIRLGMPGQLYQLEKAIAYRLRGDFAGLEAARLVLTEEFVRRGWMDGRFILGDPNSLPAGHPWRSLLPRDEHLKSDGTGWLVLGHPRVAEAGLTALPRLIYRAEDVISLTRRLEAKRRADEAEIQREAAERDRIAIREMEATPARQMAKMQQEIEAMKAENAELRARQAERPAA